MSAKRILRPAQVHGPNNKIPVGHTKFFEDMVYHEGGDEFVPGTKIRRLRRVPLGERAIGFLEDEVDALIEGLRAHRDAVAP
jgi:hypothetical protein